MKDRLDKIMVDTGLVKSRERAILRKKYGMIYQSCKAFLSTLASVR